MFLSIGVYGQEICNNAIDDDGDGDIDMNDADCACTGFGINETLESLIPNSSFEDRSCCPSGFSQLNCASTWIQASTPTSDYWNTCGQAGNSAFGLAPIPIPDGAGFVGFYNNDGWQECIGACLLSPMIAGTTYNLNFYIAPSNNSPAFNLTFYGSPNCNDLPFNSNGCPVGIGSWLQLGQIAIPTLSGWSNFTISFTPSQTINTLVLGGGCGEGTSSYSYYYVDDLTLVSSESFSVLHLNRTGKWCDDDVVLTATKDTILGTYQWYRDGIALIGETNAVLNVSANNYGAGEYRVVLSINGQCESLTEQVVEAPDPVALAYVQSDCESATLNFSDQSGINTGAIVSWDWDFGDTGTSNQQHPTHQYGQNGLYNVSLTVESDSGCTDIYLTTVNAYPNPTAQFSADDGCLYYAVNFTDLSTVDLPDNIAAWTWNFDGSNTSSLPNPTFSYTTEGDYNVELIVETDNGCKDTVIETISLKAVPTADFTFDTVCAGFATSFTDASSINIGNISSYQWQFNPGTSVLPSPQNTFNTGGQYSVELLVVSDEGCRDSITYTVPVNPNPVADFTFTEACLYQSNDFQDISVVSTGNISQWDWDFGDTYTDNTSNPSHIYALSGPYNVTLQVITDKGCSDDIVQVVQVHDLPVADFTFTNECLNTPFQFNEASTLPNGNINAWEWDFGDQSTYMGQNPPDHSFPAPSTYDVTLIVESGNACADTLVQQVEVYPEPHVDFTYHNVCFGEINYFTDQTVLANANISNWDWNFGDNTSSVLQNPSRQYTSAGTYDVRLKVFTENGCSGDTNHIVIVNPSPEVEFTFEDVCLNEITDFTDESSIQTGSLLRWDWAFGDNVTSQAENTSHTYLTDGNFTVTLVVTSDSLCNDTITHVATVFPLPEVALTADVFEGCQPLEVNFIDQSSVSSGSVVQWLWDVGANTPASSLQYPNYTYDSIGTYSVSLTAITNEGCKSSYTFNNMINVFPVPIASFTASPQPTTIIYPWVEFTDGSSADVITWDWDLGDGTFSTAQNPEHEYADTGAYNVRLIVYNQFVCADTADDVILVNGAFTFYIPNSFTPNNDGYNDNFFGEGIGIKKFALRIFDRWGEMVFFTDNPKAKWDGTLRGNTQPVQNEVFVYVVEIEDIFGETHLYNGHVTLVK